MQTIRRKLHILLSLLILAAAAEGVVLCKNKNKHTPAGNGGRPGEDGDETVESVGLKNVHNRSQRNNDYFSDEEEYIDSDFRMESFEDKTRASQIMDDMAEMRAGAIHSNKLDRFRKESAMNDAGILEAMLRADSFSEEASRRNSNSASSEEESRRGALMNRMMRKEQVRGEGIEEDGFSQDGFRRVENERFDFASNSPAY